MTEAGDEAVRVVRAGRSRGQEEEEWQRMRQR